MNCFCRRRTGLELQMLSLSSIVRVTVNTASPVAAGSAFSTGLILAPSSSAVTEETRLRLYASAADMRADGFSASDPPYLAASAYFAASPAPDRLYVGLYASAETPADIFRQILGRTADFYGVCLCEADPAVQIAFLEAFPALVDRMVLFCAGTGTVAEALAASGILRKAFATGSNRILTVYGADLYAAPAVMGTAMGLSRAYSDSAFALCYQQIPGMLPTDLTESEIASLKAVNANVYITRGANRRLLENGTTVSGIRLDEELALDRISADLQEAALSLLTGGSGKLPQTDETSAVFINRFSAVLAGYAAAGVLAAGRWRGSAAGRLQPGDTIENGYLLWAESYDLQSDADRAAHKAMPIHVALCMAGSVETLLIEIDVSI